eukprot:gene2594-59625_t
MSTLQNGAGADTRTAPATFKIADIEAEMARTRGPCMKARLAKLKAEVMESQSKGGGGKQDGFESTLLNKLTNTFSEVAAYEFTTLTCVPGVVNYGG